MIRSIITNRWDGKKHQGGKKCSKYGFRSIYFIVVFEDYTIYMKKYLFLTQRKCSINFDFLLQLIYNVLSISTIHQGETVTHTHIYIYINIYIFFFSRYLPSCSNTSDQTQFPVLYSRISLLIHSKFSSLQILTPNYQSIPLLSHPSWQLQVCFPSL